MSESALAYAGIPSTDDYDAAERTDEQLVMDLLAPQMPVSSQRAAQILAACRGLAGLPTAEPAGMVGEGVGADEAAALLAALEIGRRIAEQEILHFNPLEKLPSVVAYLALRYQRRTQEVMGALFLNRHDQLLHHRVFYRGTLSRASVEPRAILEEALLKKTPSVIMFHTHPSGDPSPSLEDIVFTRRMARAGEIMGVKLLDHLVIAGVQRWESLRKWCRLG